MRWRNGILKTGTTARGSFGEAVVMQERGSGSKEAAFLLHQATERYYHAAILVFTGYKQRTHDIELLGVQAGEQHALMVDLLPKTEPDDKHLFDLLKKAYIDARYSMSYRITAEELAELQKRVLLLADRVRAACLERSRRSAERTRCLQGFAGTSDAGVSRCFRISHLLPLIHKSLGSGRRACPNSQNRERSCGGRKVERRESRLARRKADLRDCRKAKREERRRDSRAYATES